MSTTTTSTAANVSLNSASVDRLASLLRHWAWTEEAMARFGREVDAEWDYGDDSMSNHPFGAYYHWCALLCAFAEAALDHSLLLPQQLDRIRQDIEASLPGLRASRQLLTVIPASLEEQPRLVDLLHDDNLSRLRRIHRAFGEALHQEQTSRELNSLDRELTSLEP
jgi:hypothetical protein